MRTLAIITIIFIFTGCNPYKRLQRKCPPIIRDSISYVETIKLDTITLVSPADTLIIRIPVEPDINDLIVDVADKPGPSVAITISDGIMEIIAVCPEDSLKAIINSLHTELNNQTTVTVEKIVEVPRMPKIGWICVIISIVSVLLLIFIVYLKIKGGAVTGVLKRFS